jgi:hypothetical protein
MKRVIGFCAVVLSFAAFAYAGVAWTVSAVNTATTRAKEYTATVTSDGGTDLGTTTMAGLIVPRQGVRRDGPHRDFLVPTPEQGLGRRDGRLAPRSAG